MKQLLSTTAALLGLVAMFAVGVRGDGTTAEDFACPLCQVALKLAVERRVTSEADLQAQVCADRKALPFDPCPQLVAGLRAAFAPSAPAAAPLSSVAVAKVLVRARTAAGRRQLCGRIRMCPVEGAEAHARFLRAAASDAALHGVNRATVDLRVSLPYAARGYDAVRVTVVNNGASFNATDVAVDPARFDYSAPFIKYWSEKTLYTGVKPLAPLASDAGRVGGTFDLGGQLGNITASIPAKGKGVKLLLVADPCFSSEYLWCPYGDSLQIFTRLSGMLNAALGADVDAWAMLGDNFYDPHGVLSPAFMAAMSLEAKSKPLVTLPGNHDFWQLGLPYVPLGYDQFGHGFMQYWGTDSAAAFAATSGGNASAVPFNLTNQGNVLNPLADVRNFFSYNMIGNLVLISFSGAHTQEESAPLFAEACQFVKTVNPAYVFVLGHWNEQKMGCQKGMTTADVHHYLTSSVDGCSQIANRIKYFEGHVHCNLIVAPHIGFRVAGFGMNGCDNFGFPLVEISDDGTLDVSYFPIVGGNGTVPSDQETPSTSQDIDFNSLIACVQEHGLSGCKNMGAVSWLHQTQ